MRIPKPRKTKVRYKDFFRRLSKKYGDPIAEGRDAEVFLKNDKRVIKLFTTNNGRTFDKEPYIKFLRAAQKNNPYFPKIYSIKLYDVSKRSHVAVIEMEKLIGTSDEAFRHPEEEACLKALADFGNTDALRKLRQPQYRGDHLFAFTDMIDSILLNDFRHQRPLSKNARATVRAIESIRGTGNNDMHHENVMIRASRGKHHMVIIDPVC